MSSVFISHRSTDSAAAEELSEWLRGRGHQSVFLDFDPEIGIPAGRDWEQELYRQLRTCQAVIVLCSRDSLESHWCFAEITHAKALGKVIFPILLDDCQIHPLLADRQAIDFTGDRDEARERLGRGLAEAGVEVSFPWDRSRPPYPGLLSFQEDDAAIFFGRDAEIQRGLEILERLQRFGGVRALMVLGASGSGKSSLVRAGLLPRLRLHPSRWLVVPPFRPSERPWEALAAAMSEALAEHGRERHWREIRNELHGASASRHAERALIDLARDLREAAGQPRATVLLTIDQLEEVLGDVEGSAGFLSGLRAALATEGTPLQALTTLRSDLLGDFQHLAASRDLQFEDLTVGPMTVEDLLEVINGPARVHDLRLEDGLVEAIVRDTQTEDALPLLAFTLRELYERFGGDSLLEVREYREELGGLSGSVAKAAEAVLARERLSAEEKSQLRAAFLSMVRLDDKGHYARRTARRQELPEPVHRLLERFVEARLLVSRREDGGEVFEVAHEALFRSWARLRRWLEQSQEFLLWRRRLERAREEWERARRDRRALLAGPALEESRQWLDRRTGPLEPEAEGFIRESMRHATRRRLLRLTLLAAAVAFLAITAVAGLSLWRRAEAQRARAEDTARVAVASEWMLKDPTKAALVLQEVRRPEETALAVARMRDALDHGLSELVLAGHAGRVTTAELSPDGRRVVTASLDGTARVWHADGSNRYLEFAKHGEGVVAATFTPDGEGVVTAGESGAVWYWKADGSAPPTELDRHRARVTQARFNREGDRLLTVSQDGAARVSTPDGSARPVDLRVGDESQMRAAFLLRGDRVVTVSWEGAVRIWKADGSSRRDVREAGAFLDFAAISPFGDRVITVAEDGSIWVGALDGSAEPRTFDPVEGRAVAASFNDRGDWLLTTSERGLARLWRLDGEDAPTLLAELPRRAVEAAFSSTGQWLVTVAEEGPATAWHLDAPETPVLLRGHTRRIWALSFHPSSNRVLTASEDGSARVWKLGSRRAFIELSGHDAEVTHAGFDPYGSRVVTTSVDATARIWKSDGSGDPAVLDRHDKNVVAAAFNRTGDRMLTASSDGTVRIWYPDDWASPIAFDGDGTGATAAAFSPDGSRVAAAFASGEARVWSIGDEGEPVVLAGHQDLVRRLAFSPAGDRLVTASLDGTARVWRADGAGDPVVLAHDGTGVRSAVFSPRGDRVVTGSEDGKVRVWNADGSGRPTLLEGHSDAVVAVEFSPAGDRILTASNDRTARVWSADGSSEPLVLQDHGDRLTVARFSPDGRYVVTASGDGTARVWRADGSGAPLVLEGHSKRVTDAAFSPDGSRIVTSSEDRTARIWLISAAELKQTLAEAVATCLDPGFRQGSLGETPAEARSAHAECAASRRRD